MQKELTEEDVLKEHTRECANLGHKVYQFCVPFLEMSEHLKNTLSLNRKMFELKQKEKDVQGKKQEPKLVS